MTHSTHLNKILIFGVLIYALYFTSIQSYAFDTEEDYNIESVEDYEDDEFIDSYSDMGLDGASDICACILSFMGLYLGCTVGKEFLHIYD